MTIEIKLDTGALNSLIEKDPDFRLKLQQCVLANVARKHVKGVQKEIEDIVQSEVKHQSSKVLSEICTFGKYSVTLNEGMKEKVKEQVKREVWSEIDQFTHKNIKEQVELSKPVIEALVKAQVEKVTKEAIAAEVKI